MSGGKSKDKKEKLPYHAKLNSAYQKHDFKVRSEAAFKEKQHLEHDNGVTIYNEPFQCCSMPDFVKDPQFLEGLKEELIDQIFYDKNNDLYKFQQTDDLKNISTPHIKLLRKLLYEDFGDWLTDVTGISFTNKVNLTCSRYDHSDVLLCHDDELDTRRVAFILYLVPPWTMEDGGRLDLFSMDEHGDPKEIVRSLVPNWNSFVWFEVTEASYHQVSEILCSDKTRLSVNGWFHSPPQLRPDRYIEPPHPLKPHTVHEDDVIGDWINPIYLDPEVQGQIQEKFESDSEIELQGFLREDKYQAVVAALCSESVTWTRCGPPNKRHYDRAAVENLPDIIRECQDVLCSEEMFLTLSNLTGLTLHQLTVGNNTDSDIETDSCPDVTPGSSTVELPSDTLSEVKEDAMTSPVDDSSDKSKPLKKRQKIEVCDDEVEKEHEKMETKEIKEVNPLCHSEVRRWGHGCYTLLHDTDRTQSDLALDAMFFCSCKGWRQECGGYTSYITKGEDEELLSVNPAENSLALVYRDKETLKFVKHINSRISELHNGPSFYDFHLVYYE